MSLNVLSVSLMEGWAGCRMDPALSYGLIRASRGPLDKNVLAHGMSHDVALAFSEMFEAAKEVMAHLEKHGGAGWPHLCDTDDNAGQRLREALAKIEQTVKV
jgi:hypothetical protein